MSEYYGGDFIATKLNASTALSALVSTEIHNARLLPDGAGIESVNYYPVIPYNPRLETFASTWSVDCRSATEWGALAIAQAVVTALNRVDAAVGGFTYFAVCNIGGAVPPIDNTDAYNVPVSVELRRR